MGLLLCLVWSMGDKCVMKGLDVEVPFWIQSERSSSG